MVWRSLYTLLGVWLFSDVIDVFILIGYDAAKLGNCLPTLQDSIVISSTTEDKSLNIVFRFMWTNIRFKVHSCIYKCSFVSIICLPNIAFISNSWH